MDLDYSHTHTHNVWFRAIIRIIFIMKLKKTLNKCNILLANLYMII